MQNIKKKQFTKNKNYIKKKNQISITLFKVI